MGFTERGKMSIRQACFPDNSVGKESACNARDLGSIPGLGRSPAEGKGYPFHYSGLENSMDCIVHEVAKSQTQLSDFHFQTSFGQVPVIPLPVLLAAKVPGLAGVECPDVPILSEA